MKYRFIQIWLGVFFFLAVSPFLRLSVSPSAHAQTGPNDRIWNGSTDKTWNTSANWTPADRPNTSTESAFVLDNTVANGIAAPTSTFFPIDWNATNGTTIDSLVINTPALGTTTTALVHSRGRTFNIAGTFTHTSGVLSMSDVSAIVDFAGNYNQGGGTLSQTSGLIRLSGASRTFSGVQTGFTNLTVSGTITMASGAAIQVTAGAGQSFTISGTLTLGVNGTLTTNSWTRTGTFDAGTGTVVITGNVTLNGETFHDLVIQSGTVLLGGNITVKNKLTIQSGAVLNAGSYTITIGNTGTPTTAGGDIEVNGTGQISSTGTVQLYGDGATHDFTGSGTISFGTLTIGDGNGTGSTTNFGSVSVSVTTLTLAAGGGGSPEILNTGSSNITINTGGTMTLNNANTTWNYDTSTVVWKPAASLPTVSGSTTMTFYNLTIQSAGTVTVASSTLDVQYNLTLQSGTLGNGTSKTILVGVTWINNGGSFNGTNTTVQLMGRGSSNRTVLLGGGSSTTSQTFNHLAILRSGVTAVGTIADGMTITVTGTMTVGDASNAGTLEGGGNSFLVTSTMVLAHASSSFDPGSCEVTWKGRTGQNIPANVTFFRLIVDRDNADATLAGNITVKHVLQVNGTATLNAGNNTITVNSSSVTAADPGVVLDGNFSAGTSTVVLSGTNAVTDSIRGSASSKTFYRLTIDKTTDASGVEIQTNITVSNLLYVQSGTLKLNIGFQITANGGITVGDNSPTDGTIEATLQVSGNTTVTMAGSTTVLVDYTGKLVATGTAPPIQSSSGAYAFNVYGSIEVSAATVRNTDSNGLHIFLNPNISAGNGGSNSNLVKLDNVEFAAVTTRALWIEIGASNSSGFDKTLTGLNFNFVAGPSTATVKFSAAGTSTSVARTLTILNSSGTGGGSTTGELYDDDSDSQNAPDGDSYGNWSIVTWTDPIYWQYYGTSTDWNWVSGTGTTNWKNSNGTNASLPTSASAVVVDISDPDGGGPLVAQSSANYPRIPSGYNALCKTMDLKSFRLDMVGTSTLTIGGKWTTTGTITFTAGSGKVDFIGSGDVIPNNVTFYDLSVSGTSAIAIETTGTITVNNDVTIGNGSTFKTAHTVNVKRHWVVNGTGDHDAQTGSSVVFNGSTTQEIQSDQSSKTFKFRAVTFSNSNTTSLNTAGISTLSVSGNLVVSGTSTLAGGNHTLQVQGNWTLNGSGTFSEGTSKVQLNNTGSAQSITSDQVTKTFNFYKLVIENTTSSGVNVSGPTTATLDINNNLEIGTTANPGAKLNVTNVLMTVAGDWKKNSGATFVNTGSTVTLDGTGAQNVDASSFNILKVNKSNVATAAGNLSAVQLVVVSGTFSLGSGLTHNVNYSGAAAKAVDVQSGGTLNLGSSTLNITSTLDGVTSGNEYLHVRTGAILTLNGSSVLTLEQVTLAHTPSVLINGTINSSGATPPEIRDATPSTAPHYTFKMVSATINISAITFKDFDVNGVLIQNPTSVNNGTSNQIDRMNFAAKDSSNSSTYSYSLAVDLTAVNLSLTFKFFTFNTAGNGAPSSVPDNINGANLDASDSIVMQMGDPASGEPAPGTYGNSSDEHDPNGRITWIGTVRWTGGALADGNWTRSDNWNTGATPTSSDNVIVPDIATSSPPWDVNAINTTATSRNFTVKYGTTDGAKVTMDQNTRSLTVSGDFILEDGGYVRIGYNTSDVATENSFALLVNGHWDDRTVGGVVVGSKGFRQLVPVSSANDRVTLNGTNNQYIKGVTTFGNVRIGDGAAASVYYLYTGGTVTVATSGFFEVAANATFRGGDISTSGTPATMVFNSGSAWTHTSANAWDPDESTVKWYTANAFPNNGGGPSKFYNLEIGDGAAALTVTMTRDLVVLNNLTINPNATLNTGIYNITVGGGLVVNGTLNFSGAGSQTITFDAAKQSVQDITPGATVFEHVNGTTTQTLNLAGTTTIAGTFTLSNNTTLKLNTYTLEARGDVVENSSTLTADTGTFYLNGTSQPIPYTSFYNLKLNTAAATYYLKASTAVTNNFDMTSGTLDYQQQGGGAVYNMTFNGNVTISGTSTVQGRSGTTATTTFNLAADKTLSYSATTGDLTFNHFVKQGANKLTYTADAVTKNMIFAGTLTVSAGTFDLGSGFTGSDAHTVSSGTGVSVTGGTLDLNSSTMTLTSTSAGVSVSGGVVKMTNNSAILDVDGYFSCTAGGTLDCTGSTAEIRVAGAWTMSGVYNTGSSTVIFNVAGAGVNSNITITTAAATDFYKLIIDKNGSTKAVIAGGTTQTVDIGAGNLVIRRGAFETSSKTVTVAGNVAQDTVGATGTLTVGDSTPLTGGQLTVTGDVTVTAGTLNVNFPSGPGDGLLILNGATFAPTALTAGNGTIRFSNSTADRTVPSFTYNNIHIANGTTYKFTPAGTLTAGGTLQVGVSGVASGKFELAGATTHTAGTLRFENGGILGLSTRTLQVSGTVTAASGAGATVNFNTGILDVNGSTFNAADISLQFGASTGELQLSSTSITFGTVSPSNGTITFDNTANGTVQTVPAVTYFNLKSARGSSNTALNTAGAVTVSNNFVVASGSFTASAAMDINGTVTVTGTFTAGPYTHTVAGDWINSAGTFTDTQGKIIFDGSSQTINTTGAGTNYFYDLQIGNTAGNSNTTVAVTATGNLNLNRHLTIKNTSRLNLRSGTHSVASAGKVTVDAGGTFDIQDSSSNATLTANRTAEVSPTPDFDVAGTLYLRDRAVIKLPNNAKLGITGTLNAVGTTTVLKPVIQGITPATDYFYFLMNNATISVDGLGINSVRNAGTGQFAQGVEIKGVNTNITQFNRVLFQNAQGPGGGNMGIHLKLTVTGDWTTSTALTFSGLSFDGTYTVSGTANGDAPPRGLVWAAGATTTVTVTVSNPYQSDETTGFSLVTGEAHDYDDDDRGSALARVVWEEAYIWDGSQSTDWYDVRNWSTEGLGQFPGGANPRRDVILRNVGNAPALGTTTAAHAKNLTLEAGTNFTISGAGTFSVSGNISMAGTSTMTPGTSTFIMDGSGAQSITLSGTATFTNLNVVSTAASGTKVSAAGSFTVTGAMTVTRGTFATNSGVTVTVNGLTTIDDATDYTVDGTLDLTNGTFKANGGINNTSTAVGTNEGSITFGAMGTGTLRVASAGTWTNSGSFTRGNGTVIYSGATKNVTQVTYYNVTLENDGAARTYSLTGTTTVANNLTIENNTTLDVSASVYDLKVGGHWIRQTTSGIFTARTGTVTLNGSSAQQIQNAETFYNLTVDTGSSVTCLGATTVSNQLQVVQGTYDLGTSLTHNVNASGGTAVLISPKAGASGATIDLNTSRLLINNGGIKIDEQTPTTNEGKLDMTGTSTVGGSELVVAGSFHLNGGILDLSTFGPRIDVAGSWTAAAGSTVILTNSTATVKMTATSGSPTITTLNSGDFQNLEIALGSAITVTLESSIDVRGNIVFTSGTLAKGAPSSVTITVYGNWDDNNGADNFNQSGTTVTFAGSGASNIDPDTFNHMTVSKSNAPATALGTITVSGTLTMSGGTLALSSYTGHSFGTIDLSGGTMALNTSTSSASGNVTVAGGAILDMDQGSMSITGTLSVTGVVDMPQNSAATYDLDVTGDIVITAGGTLTGTGSNIGIRTAGNWTDSGGAISWSTTAAVTMSGSGKTITVPDGITTNDFNHLTITGTVTATQGMDINGDLTVEAGGTLNLDNGSQKTHDVAGNITVKASGSGYGVLNFKGSILRISQAPASVTQTVTFQVSGSNKAKWVMDNNSQFLLANNNKIVCDGDFICDGAYTGQTAGDATGAAKPKISAITEDGTQRHELWLQGGIDIRNLLHKYKNANGMTIGGSVNLTSVTTFDNIDFRNSLSGGRHLRIGGSVTGSKTSNGCSFDSTYVQGTGYNVESMSSTSATLTFANVIAFGGEGEDYDLEWDGGNHIVWIIQTTWTGASNVDGDWNRNANWSNGVPGQDSTAIIEDVQTGASIFDAVIAAGQSYTIFGLTVKKHGAAADANGGDLTLNGTLIVRGDLTIEGTTTVSTEWGRISMGNAGSRMEARGKWTDEKGGLNQTNGIVVFNGTIQQEVVGTATFRDLRLSNDVLLRSSASATADTKLSITGTTTGLTIDSGKTFTVQSQHNTYRPILALGGTATVVGTGTFVAKRDATSNAKPRVTNTTGSASDRFGFTLNGGVDITALEFRYGNSNGLNIETGATLTNLQGIDFSYGSTSSTSRHLRIARSAQGRIDCPNVTFDLVGTNTANSSGTPYNVTVTSTAAFVAVFVGTTTLGGPGAGEDKDEDVASGKAEWTDGLNVISSYAGTETSGEDGGLVGYFFPGTSASYGLMRRGSPGNPLDDEVKAVSPSTGATLATYTVSHATYGPVVGRPLVSGDDVFFGTKGGYVFNVRYSSGTFTTVQAVRPVNSGITAIEITSPIISDLPLNSYTMTTSNLYFGALGTATQPYFFGVKISDFTQRPASTSFPISLFAGTATYTCRSEPSIDSLTISGTTTRYIFIGTDEDGGTPSYAHIMRLNIQTGLIDVEFTEAPNRPISNVGAPIQEFAGVLTTGTVTANGTSTAYLIKTDLAGTMTSFANWPLTGSTGTGGAGPNYSGGIEGGIDTDAATNVAFGTVALSGTATGYFYNRNFSTGANIFTPAALDGSIRMYPVFNTDGGADVYYVGTDNGKLYRVNAATGAKTVKLDLGVGQRIRGVSFNGTYILVSTSEGVLYVVPAGP